MKAIASVPSREELLSKLLGSIQSPISNFARVLKQIAENGGAADASADDAKAEAPAEEAKEEAKVEEAKEEAPAEATEETKAEATKEAKDAE